MNEYENFKEDIGSRLKKARRERELTQEQFSEMLGISQKHYSEVERGNSGLSVKHLIKASDILSISLDYLLKGEKDAPKRKNIDAISLIDELYYSSSQYTQKQMICLLQIAQDIERHAEMENKTPFS